MITVGYGSDSEGMSTRKYQILAETTDGRYVVCHLRVLMSITGKEFIAETPLEFRGKEEIQGIHEEEI